MDRTEDKEWEDVNPEWFRGRVKARFGIGGQFTGLGSFFHATGGQTQGIGPDLLGKMKVRIWVRLVIFMDWNREISETVYYKEEPDGTAGRLGHGAGDDFAALYRGAATQAGDFAVAGHEAH